jgi:integrase
VASLRARHQRTCKLGRAWTTFAEADNKHGCTCKPSYEIHHGGGRNRQPVGRNRKEAARALAIVDGQVAARTFHIPEERKFSAWADEWLERHTARASTTDNYRVTLEYAKQVFGGRKVRDVGPEDVSRFLDHVREENRRRTPNGTTPHEVTPATQAKHLRQLGACFADAILRGYADTNPVRRLPKSERPRVGDPEANYFTDEELVRLWPELAGRPVYLALHKVAVTTGLRFGELAALDWSDVGLLEGKLYVRRAYRNGQVSPYPKTKRSRRTVNLTPAARAVLERWNGECGGPDAGLVFEREEGGHMQNEHVLRRVLYPALGRAGIPRVGEREGTRTFHSLRDTYARIALEAGAPLQWVSGQLGHSSTAVTERCYGRWAAKAEQEQADRLPAEAFTV